ncbi:hypothetical protein TcasGA2_TC031079 [Tribolium castaneum]|uniref:Uncharacterized protein n=1 Tax=Tribolium castaneum TaxID=7070 RepID=A0A139W9V6_TRICA|nr:hypothetical protein TcasGA2_TC031079 [Tribolium castaneum]
MNVENYRPIAIIPILGKIIEILVKERLFRFFEKYNLLSNSQFGFRKGRCTITALRDMVEDVVDCLDGGHAIGAVFV